ncbi:MAG: hypothetical protein IKZ45_01855 [Fibrobacter sp.]|nr:hypothetical protein [Fibrobacter sp.]
MYKLVSLFFAFFLATAAFAQHGGPESVSLDGNAKHTITFNRGFFGDDYTVDGRESNVDEVENLLPYVPDANDQWKTGNILRYVSWGVAFVGGFCVGYGIMDAQSDMEYGTFGNGRGPIIIGGALAIVAGLIMEKVGNSKKDGAIELYNSQSGKNQAPAAAPDVPESSAPESEETSFNIQVGPTPQGGIGLAFNF